jgi:hypothetical protein
VGTKAHPSEPASPQGHISPLDDHQKATVLRELESILSSHVFRTSERCKQFLSYVVKHTLEGQGELLKERTIGIEIFHRPPMYATGDDPVVRVKATEVRRRLAQFYLEESHSPEVRIEIPVGSYVPEFHWTSAETPPRKEEPLPSRNRAKRTVATISLLVLALAVVLAVFLGSRLRTQPVSALDQFWAPLFTTSQPVLICLASPVVYRPSLNLFKKYSEAHPTELQTEVERFNSVLPLSPDEAVKWRDMEA